MQTVLCLCVCLGVCVCVCVRVCVCVHCENSLHHHAHVKGNWLIVLMYLSVSDIEYYTCVYP